MLEVQVGGSAGEPGGGARFTHKIRYLSAAACAPGVADDDLGEVLLIDRHIHGGKWGAPICTTGFEWLSSDFFSRCTI